MSTHSEKVWILILDGVGIIDGSHARLRRNVIYKADSLEHPWKEMRAAGYRCVRAVLTWEEKDGEKD